MTSMQRSLFDLLEPDDAKPEAPPPAAAREPDGEPADIAPEESGVDEDPRVPDHLLEEDAASFDFGCNLALEPAQAPEPIPAWTEPAWTPPATEAPPPPDQDPLLADLTEAQRQAVTHVDGPVIVVAGPGSGKTRVLSRRVAWLVQRAGVPPWRILAITFTNKAADEMRERIENLLIGEAARNAFPQPSAPRSGVFVSTFHSFAARMLRRYGPLGRDSDFTIYDSDDQRACMKRVIREAGLDPAQFKPRSVLARISQAKNAMIDADAFAEQALGWSDETIARLYRRYEEALEQFNALDFDDLLLGFVRLLEARPEVLEELRERFRYLLVDEYQDTNRPQYRIANLLAGPNGNLFVVGDPDQSIYKWRGADIRNILEFERDHPAAREIRLEQNYRSTKSILAAAQALISHNAERRDKALYTHNPEGEPLRWVRLVSDAEEAEFVAAAIERRLEAGTPADEIAIFYRANALSRRFEEALRKRVIRHVVIGAVPFWQRREVKDVLAYLRLLTNPQDEQALMRVFGLTEGIGRGTIRKVQDAANQSGRSLLETLLDAEAPLAVRGKQRKALAQLKALFETLRAMPTAPVKPLLDHIVETSGYYERLKSSEDPDEQLRAENVAALIDSAAEFDARDPESGVRGFLDQAALLGGADEDAREGAAVRLMTLHAAKGLEFDEVFIVGFDDRLLPLERDEDGCDLEEERRLFYVGLTRARHRVTLTSVMLRRTWGQERVSRPSRFLAELPSELLQRHGPSSGVASVAPQRTARAVSSQERALAATNAQLEKLLEQAKSNRLPELRPGDAVKHAVFGHGRVIEVAGRGPARRVRVRFEQTGERTLVLQYAQLERL